jgi:hypothetical protein
LKHRAQEVSPEDIIKPLSFRRDENDTAGLTAGAVKG